MHRSAIALLVAVILVASCAPSDYSDSTGSYAVVGDQGMNGELSCDFELPPEMDMSTVGPIIERDRMYMAERPGLYRKHIPFFFDLLRGRLHTGGRYLFETHNQAEKYLDWARDDFVLDGIHFFDRPYFLQPECHVWRSLGAHYFEDVESHYFLRTERFYPPPEFDKYAEMIRHWPIIRAQAQQRGLAGVTFSYSKADKQIQIVHFANRDVFDLIALDESPTLGLPLLEEGHTKNFDRTQFVLAVWFPFVPGDQGQAALWPNSPPLPAPSCGDGVCEVSRGEDASSCAGDCPPNCGDTICQPQEGEDTQTCPGDCRLE